MSIAKVKLDESTKLEFGVSITGAESRPTAKLVIDGPDFSIGFPCKPVTEGVEVVIGKLKNMLPAGEYPVRMEIVIENKLYIPFRDTIVLEPSVHVMSTPKAVVESKDTVTVTPVTVRSAVVVENRDPKHIKIAKLIATTLRQSVDESMSPVQMINEALTATPSIDRKTHRLLVDILEAADHAGVSYDRMLLPPVI